MPVGYQGATVKRASDQAVRQVVFVCAEVLLATASMTVGMRRTIVLAGIRDGLREGVWAEDTAVQPDLIFGYNYDCPCVL